MKKAKVSLSWVPSPSMDVVNVHVLVEKVHPDGNTVEFEVDVTPEVDTVEVGTFNEGDMLHAVVSVSDGTYTTPAEVSVTIPDLTEPAPVEMLGFNWEVVDDEVVV